MKNKSGQKNRNILFSKLESPEEGLKTIKAISYVMMGWLLIQCVVIAVLHHFTIATAIVLIIYSFVIFNLWKFKSRIAAVILFILLVYALFFVLMTFPKAALIASGILIPIIGLSGRAVEATFKFHGQFSK